MSVRAVIVGIETYGDGLDDVASPAANALSVAQWAITHGIAPKDVCLFVAAIDPGVEDTITRMGLRNRGATRRDIENVLRTELAGVGTGGIAPGSSLLFYWSGHGMTDRKGSRLLFCADYSRQLTDRVFNASLFLRDLRTDEYEGYRSMLALMDVCGTNSDLRVQPAEYDPDVGHKRNHLTYFATPEGGYARAATGEGAFTFYALNTLRTFGAFPDISLFKDRLEAELAGSGLPRFLLDGRSEGDEWERRFGKAEPSADQRANSLVELLVDLGVPNADVEKAYRATAWTLKNSRLPPPAGITGSVGELSALHSLDRQAPGGLVQYALRLAETFPEHEDSLMAWLKGYASPGTVRDEQDKIEQTRGASLLIIEVLADKDGRIRTLDPRLRTRDTADAVGPRLQPVDMRDGYAVEPAMQDLLSSLEADGFGDLEIHFLVDATVLDYPFHQLPSLHGDKLLGESFGVVLHHRERFLKARTPAKRFWLSRARDVSAVAPADLSWTRCMEGEALPTNAPLCLAHWLPSGPGKRVLAKLLDLGVPYLYWPLVDGELNVGPSLDQFVQKLTSHAGMADAILARRISDAAASGSVLWDDVDFKP